jgi:protein dithiol oxidoreductase (disulfide-forming)
MKALLKPFAFIALLFAGTAFAQPALYVDGTHYETLAKPVRTADPSKIEVTEVFWYGCPHCYAFEPLLESWVGKLPADVSFVRSPVIWDAATEFHAKVFAVEQALGSFEKTHKPIFDAFHQKHNRLLDEKSVRELFVAQGVDGAAFDKTWASFGVSSAVKQASTKVQEYGITGVPSLVVNGKYRISTGEAVKTQADMLKVVDFLVAKDRAATKK